MQRFLRDPLLNPQVEQISQAYDERVAIIQKHFPPSVAAAYAIPRLGSDNCLEWWTTQQGQVLPFNAITSGQQQALLHAYATHQAQLESLASTLDTRGMQSDANVIRSLISPAKPDALYSVESRLLIAHWYPADPSTSSTDLPPPAPGKSWRWLWISAILLLALSLLLLGWWWFWERGSRQSPVVTPLQTPPTLPPSTPDESASQQPWPAELVFLLDNSDIMSQRRDADSPVRMDLARHEVERILASLPPHTDTHLWYTASGTCSAAPVHHGPYSADQRQELQAKLNDLHSSGPSPLSASLASAAATVDGRERDALIFAFVGGPDACGEDICAAARAIHTQKPKLRINLVDLSGQRTVDTCIADATNGMVYFWGVTDPAHAVDLAQEASKLLAQPAQPNQPPLTQQ